MARWTPEQLEAYRARTLQPENGATVGLKTEEAFAKDSIKAQMEIANRRGATWALVIGQKEVLDGTAIVRDMDSGTQEIVDYRKAVQEIKKKLGRAEA